MSLSMLSGCNSFQQEQVLVENKGNRVYGYNGTVILENIGSQYQEEMFSSTTRGHREPKINTQPVKDIEQLSDNNHKTTIEASSATSESPTSLTKIETPTNKTEETNFDYSSTRNDNISPDSKKQTSDSELVDNQDQNDQRSDHKSNLRGSLSASLPENSQTKIEIPTTNTALFAQHPAHLERFIWPLDGGKVLRHMKDQPKGFKEGITISAPSGTIVHAIDDGTIIYSGDTQDRFGNLILIKHSSGYTSAYAHIEELMVKAQQKVEKGQSIAKVGETGSASEPQLYFSLMHNKIVLDPEKQYLGGK